MKMHKSLILTLGVAVLAVLAGPVAATTKQGDRGVVLEWNQILESQIGAAGLASFRYYAMMHIAMFDAVNSIEGGYRRYHVLVPTHPAASAEAAAAQAARDVLVALIPSAQATFDAALQSRLATIHPQARAAQGAAVGKKVAQAVLDWRANDGYAGSEPPYVPPMIPGLWQGLGNPPQVAAFVRFGSIEPFALLTATQYLPKPPPFLDSEEYAQDFEQVKLIGASNSATRTDEQTLLARLFAGPPNYSPNPFALWNHVGRALADSKNLSLIRAARMFAMLNVAMHDGLQTSHTSKYVYHLWRPATAIVMAGDDMNDATVADASWTSLIGTPPYPSHSSNLTCIGTSAARALAGVLGSDSIPFDFTWTGLGANQNATRSYASLSQLAEEGALSRVYGGIHFMFEITASVDSCKQVADYVRANYMQRRHRR